MELINNRYRIIRSLKQNRIYSTYLVSDITEEYKEIQLNLINSEFLPGSLLELYSNDFINYSNIMSDNIVRDYRFGVVSFIDNKRASENQFFFTCEYIDKQIDIFELIKNMNMNNIMEVFIEVCKAVNYLHLRGFVYGELNVNNIVVIEDIKGYKIKLKDIASIELEKHFFNSEKMDQTYFREPGLLSGGRPSRETDMYSLGVLLLCLIGKNKSETINVKREIELLKKDADKFIEGLYNHEEADIVNNLIPLIDKLLSPAEAYPYEYFQDCVDEINQSLHKNYKIFKMEDIDKLNFNNKIIDREDEINNILKSYDYMIKYKPVKRLFLVHGDTGAGKTRFLQEVEFKLGLKKANVYASYALSTHKESSNMMWVELLRKLISESDSETIEKYEAELMKFFPEIVDRKSLVPIDYLNRDKAKYRLLNRIAGFVSDSVRNKPTVIIIDNINLANEFTIDTLKYLASEIAKHSNIIMIFSYKYADGSNEAKFSEFVSSIRERKDSDIINIRDLDYGQTGELIRSILSMPYVPAKLAEKIYSQSYGNPLFINEIIKHFYSRKIIYIHQHTGLWNSDYSRSENYKDLPIPNSIEQAILNQLRDSDEKAHEILKIASVFTNAISIEDMTRFIELDMKELEVIVQELVTKGLLLRKIGDTSYVYEINNKVLKDIVYEKIDNEEKIVKHKIAASILETGNEVVSRNNYDELIIHFEKAGIKDKVKKYSLENANRMEALKDRTEQIKAIEKAILMTDVKEKDEKAELLLKVGRLYRDESNLKQAMDYYNEAEKIAKSTKNMKLMVDVNAGIMGVYTTQNNITMFKKRISKGRELLQKFDYFQGELEHKLYEALLGVIVGDYEKAEKLYNEVLDACGDNNKKIRGDALRQLAYIYSAQGRIEEGLDLYKKSIKFLEAEGSVKGMLVAYNNIGALYMDFYQDTEMALEYFTRVKDLSEEYNFPTTELLALINIANIYDSKFKHKAAYEYFKQSLEMALKADSENDVFYLYNTLIGICLKMDNYEEAYEFWLLSKKELENYPEQGQDIIVYYNSLADFHYAFGNFVEAEKNIKKAYKYYGKEESLDKIECEIKLLRINLKAKEKAVYSSSINKLISISQQFVMPENRVLSLSSAAAILAQREDYKNAQRLLVEAEKSLIGPIPDEVQANYLFAAGMLQKTEEGLKYLQTAVEIAKKIKSRNLVYRITSALGDYYYDKGNMNFAANYYIEAFEVAKSLILQVPEEFRINFVNSNYMGKSYKRVRYIKAMMDNEGNAENEILHGSYMLESLSEINEMFSIGVVSDFSTNEEFIQSIRELYMPYLPEGIHSEADIISSMGSNTIQNIELIIKYLATLTLATDGIVVINELQQDVKTIASLNDKELHINKNIFDRIKAFAEPLLISDNNKNDSDLNYLSDELMACICIPIMNKLTGDSVGADNGRARQSSTKSSILGYLYLESDKILNNFNSNGLQRCMEYVGLLAILIEKHQLKLSASIDKLTGALTRKYLEDALEDELEKSSMYGRSFSIIIYDLDKFKSVNDKFGHQTGDEVLKKVSKVVKDNIGRNDVLGRYGGEEFIIILPETNIEDAALVAEELRRKIQKERILGDKADVTVSMGVASYPTNGQFIQELVEKADQALYVAKENGRNRCQVWDSKFTSKIKGTNKLNGIISGNAVQDSRNVLAIVELIKLVNSSQSKKDKIYSFIGRIIEITEAHFGAMLIIQEGEVVQQFGRRAQDEEWTTIDYNKNAVSSVISCKQGVYMIDWDHIGNHDLITGIPDWYSILIVPIIVGDEIKGVIYLSTSTKVKEYGFNDFNFINVLSDLAATIL